MFSKKFVFKIAILLIFWYPSSLITTAQSNNTHQLFIGDTLCLAQGSLTLLGGLINDSRGVILNRGGTFSISDTLANSGVFVSNGKEIFMGNHDQYIIGRMHLPNHFGSLEKNNNGSVLVHDSVACKTLAFPTAGSVKLFDSVALLVLDSDVGAISGYSQNCNIILMNKSALVRTIDTHSIGNRYAYPVSRENGSYTPLWFEFLNANNNSLLGSNNHVSVSIDSAENSINYEAFYPSGFDFSQSLNCVGGISGASVSFSCMSSAMWNVIGPPDHEYVVYGNGDRCSNYKNRIIKKSAGASSWESEIGQTSIDSGSAHCLYSDWSGIDTITPGGPYIGFGSLAIAGSNGTSLPVELLFFEVSPVNNSYLELKWQTAGEINNDRFEIERSTDGINFSFLKTISGAGTVTQPIDYFYDDHDIEFNRTYYYRLKQVDFDGSFTYSLIRSGAIFSDDHIIGMKYYSLLGQSLDENAYSAPKQFIIQVRQLASGKMITQMRLTKE